MLFPNPTKLASADADGDAGIHTHEAVQALLDMRFDQLHTKNA